jgi:hypothetical protein
MDAIVASSSETAAFPEERVGEMMAELRACDGREHPAVGLGVDLRFDGRGFSGSVLAYEGKGLHLSAFPKDDRTEDAGGGPHRRIASPSQRRRNKGHDGRVY